MRMLFWNVANLFEPRTVDRGPQSQEEVEGKLAAVGGVLRGAFGGPLPDLIALAEVHTEGLFARIRSALPEPYHMRFEPARGPGQTGLGVLARDAVFHQIDVVDTFRPTMMQRPRAMLLDCRLGSSARFMFAVNHWKSRMVHAGDAFTPDEDRGESAEWLGERLAGLEKRDCAVVVGDFNAEPFEPPFGEFGLRSRRHFSGALWAQATPAYLYNTAWRSLQEPEAWENRSALGNAYRDRYPKTSHDTSPPVIFDQLLVSGAALRNGPITLREQSVRYFWNDEIAEWTGGGYLKPKRWRWNEVEGRGTGASDHFALLGEFDVN